MVHCSSHPRDLPTTVGKGVVVSAGAILHGCTLEDGCLVGEGAQVMDGAKIGAAAMVMPGAFVGVGKTVPAGQLWGGVPARYLREVTQAEAEKVASVSQQNALLASEHALEGAKSWQTIEQEEYDHEQMAGRSEDYYRRLTPEVSRWCRVVVCCLFIDSAFNMKRICCNFVWGLGVIFGRNTLL